MGSTSNIQLAPTDHASPAVAYSVDTVSNGLGAASIWSVPTLPSSRCPSGTCTIAQITTLYTPGPSTTVALSQLSTQGATNGQMICDTAGVASWCNPPASAVTSFNGRTGAVSPAANDYSFNQLAGNAAVGQLPTGIPATNIGSGTVGNAAFGYIANLTSDAQSQINAALPKGTVVTWIDQYCNTPGVYHQTCFSGAFTAAGSASNVTFMLGPNTYTFTVGVTISSKTGWTIAGLKDRSKIRAANGLNAAIFTLNATTDFALRDVLVDGNYQNQNAETSVISATNIVGLILQGNRFTNVKGRAVVVSTRHTTSTTACSSPTTAFPAQPIPRSTLSLRYDGLTISGNRIDGVGMDGSNPLKAAAIYITHGSTSGGLTSVGYSGNYIMASPAVNNNTFLQYGILFDAIAGPPVTDMSNSYSNIGTNCGSVNAALTCSTAIPSSVNGNMTEIFPVGYCSVVGGTPVPSPHFMGSTAAMQCISVGGTPMAAVPLAHGNGDVFASMMFETPATYNSVALSWAGYTDASGGNVNFMALMACAPFSVSSGPDFPAMPGGSTSYSVTSTGGGFSISSSAITEFSGPYGLGVNSSCPNPVTGAIMTRLYRRGSNAPDTNTGTLWIVWAKLEQNFKVQ